jgi:hypothetical protein
MKSMDELRRANERLKQENQELREILKQVTERLAAAEQKIKQLSEQLGQNSRNSNWPSSRDKSRQKPKPKSLRPKTKRKAGGQAGHKGHTLEFNPEPDEIETHRPAQCEHCRAPLAEDIVASDTAKLLQQLAATAPFDALHQLAHRHVGRHRDQQVNMIRQHLTAQDVDILLGARLSHQLPQTLPYLSQQHRLAILGDP